VTGRTFRPLKTVPPILRGSFLKQVEDDPRAKPLTQLGSPGKTELVR